MQTQLQKMTPNDLMRMILNWLLNDLMMWNADKEILCFAFLLFNHIFAFSPIGVLLMFEIAFLGTSVIESQHLPYHPSSCPLPINILNTLLPLQIKKKEIRNSKKIPKHPLKMSGSVIESPQLPCQPSPCHLPILYALFSP